MGRKTNPKQVSEIIVSIVSTVSIVSERETKGDNEPEHRPSRSSMAQHNWTVSIGQEMAERFNSFVRGSALTVLTMLTMISRSWQSLAQIPSFSRYDLAG